MIFPEFIDLNQGPRILRICSDRYGKFYQHYLKGFGWFSCLGEWTSCPFCAAGNNRKVRYYFSAIPEDTKETVGPQVLQLSYVRGKALVDFMLVMDADITSLLLNLEKTKSSLNISVAGAASGRLSTIEHDWIQMLRPVSVEEANQLVVKGGLV